MPSWSPKIAMLLFLVWKSGRFWSEYCPTYNNVASSYNIPNPSRQSRQDRPDRASGPLPKRTRNTPKDPANQPPSASSEPVRMPENQASHPAPSLQDRERERLHSLPILTTCNIIFNQDPNKQKALQSAPPTAQIANPASLKPASAPPARKAHATKSGIESSFPLQGQMSLSDGK